ncbi:MAG: acyltransferase, partial [Clostridia bacterium]|nr:acyltransferase [Deltaproteobacteria bacterium]
GKTSLGPASGIADMLVQHGHNGVELFFVVSGLVLGLPFAQHYRNGEKAVRLHDFYLRRLTRLEPPYLIALAGFYLVLRMRPGGETLTPGFLASLTYLHLALVPDAPWVDYVTWSLEIEVQFYFLMPFIARMFAIPSSRARYSAIVLSALALRLTHVFMPLPRTTIIPFVPFFFAGLMLADLWVKSDGVSEKRARKLLVVLGGVGFLGVVSIEREAGLVQDFAFAASCFGFIAACLWSRPWAALASWTPFVVVGGMCYSIYLLHYPIIAFLGPTALRYALQNGYGTTYASLVVILVPAVIAIATVYFLAVERPCMDRAWPRRLAGFLVRRPADLA